MTTAIEITKAEIRAFSLGYCQGNYGSAYESQDFADWATTQGYPSELATSAAVAKAWFDGLVWGFFSSYEDHELPDDVRCWAPDVLNDDRLAEICQQAGITGRDEE